MLFFVVCADLFKVAQVFEIISILCVGASFVGAGILAFRKYGSVTGSLFLMALGTFGGELHLQ
jgi:hypothetical protein